MIDEFEDEIEALTRHDLPQPLQDYLETPKTPARLSEVAALLIMASKLVETAAYGAAGRIREKVVIDLFELAAQLETQARIAGGLQVS
jgi:hypothetical protein